MTKREDFNEMRDSVMQEAGYWLNDYIDDETMHGGKQAPEGVDGTVSTVESLEHDPAFPYVVLFWDYVAAKFPSGLSGKNNAKDFAERGHGKFVDTTPKPKIPEDAEFITWTDPSTRDAQVASKYGNPKNRVWKMRGGL